jgi:hypothetical protein
MIVQAMGQKSSMPSGTDKRVSNWQTGRQGKTCGQTEELTWEMQLRPIIRRKIFGTGDRKVGNEEQGGSGNDREPKLAGTDFHRPAERTRVRD